MTVNLPPVEDVRAWAKALVSRYGDAFSNWLFEDGLYINSCVTLGECQKVYRENVGTPAEGGTNVALLIQFATYGEADFTHTIFDQPNRSPHDVPSHRHRGLYHSGRTQQYNEFQLPAPLLQPTLVRVVGWNSWVPELDKINVRTVEYTLYELEPAFQASIIEARGGQA